MRAKARIFACRATAPSCKQKTHRPKRTVRPGFYPSGIYHPHPLKESTLAPAAGGRFGLLRASVAQRQSVRLLPGGCGLETRLALQETSPLASAIVTDRALAQGMLDLGVAHPWVIFF